MINLEVTLPAVSAPSMSLGGNVAAKEEVGETEGDEERPFDAGLPSNATNAIGLNAKAIKAVVRREQNKGRVAAPYIFFICIPPDVIKKSETHPHTTSGRNLRISYDESLRHLIVKLVDGPHEVAGVQLYRFISKEFSDMNLELAIISTGSNCIEQKPRSKEPDSSWRPTNLPQIVRRNGPLWPSSGVDLSRWSAFELTQTGGWSIRGLRLGPAKRTSRVSTMRAQQVTVTKDGQNNITVVGAPLTIASDRVFLRDAVPPLERNITVTQQQLEFITSVTWQEAGL